MRGRDFKAEVLQLVASICGPESRDQSDEWVIAQVEQGLLSAKEHGLGTQAANTEPELFSVEIPAGVKTEKVFEHEVPTLKLIRGNRLIAAIQQMTSSSFLVLGSLRTHSAQGAVDLALVLYGHGCPTAKTFLCGDGSPWFELPLGKGDRWTSMSPAARVRWLRAKLLVDQVETDPNLPFAATVLHRGWDVQEVRIRDKSRSDHKATIMVSGDPTGDFQVTLVSNSATAYFSDQGSVVRYLAACLSIPGKKGAK